MKKVDTPVKTTKKTPIKAIVKPRLSSKSPKKTEKPEDSPKKVQNKKKVHKSTSTKKWVEKKVESRSKEYDTRIGFNSNIPKVGQPPKYKSVEQLATLIDEYFESCWAPKMDMFGNFVYYKDKRGKKTDQVVMVQVRPYTITGLAFSIGTSREGLLNYEKKDKYFDTIKRAKDACHRYAEESLFIGKNPAGAIFNLKNNYQDWKDKQEIDAKHSGNLIVNEINYRDESK